MSDNKTIANSEDVGTFIVGLADSQQADDSRELIKIMQEISGEPPVMWGAAIVGFGSSHYKYASGREGDQPKLAFSPRKGKISLYVTYDAAKLTAQFPGLGKYAIGKGCIYINKLADVDLSELKKLVQVSFSESTPSGDS